MEINPQCFVLKIRCLQLEMPWHFAPDHHHHAVQQIRKDWVRRHQRQDLDLDYQTNFWRVQESSRKLQSFALWYYGHQSKEIWWRFLGFQRKDQRTWEKISLSSHSRLWWQRHYHGQIQIARLLRRHPQPTHHPRWTWKETRSSPRHV